MCSSDLLCSVAVYSRADLLRILHITPRQLANWERNGLVTSAEAYSFSDLLEIKKVRDLCADRKIRAIRLFQDSAGWTPHYTNSGVDRGYEPVCWGPRYIPPQNSPQKQAS